MGVVREQQDGSARSTRGQKIERRQTDEEYVRRSRSIAQAEGGLQSRALARRQRFRLLQHRSNSLVERPKGQMCLGCHAAEAEYAHSMRLSAVLRNLEQCRFSDPWFATDKQCGAAVSDTVKQPLNNGNIVLAPIERW